MPILRIQKQLEPQKQNKITNSNQEMNNNNAHTSKISPYEQSREERIKENLERMQKLGIMDLSSLKLKSCTAHRRIPKSTNHSQTPPLLPRGPVRRSSRLQNATPVSYSEVALTKKTGLLENENIMLEDGSKPEIYTEEHEKLLGNTERSWTLFVDGCGKDGKRIYDQMNGKTCHQCRQKTLGYRTHCSKCKIVQGQFCGDCLYMRYGEHVLEALENPEWICPVCRGICNCSLCRQAKGWAPTGPLYRKISSLRYKSVAHYLIQTRCSQNTANEVSAKRSLPFSDMAAASKESPQVIDKQVEQLKHQSDDQMLDEFKSESMIKISSSRNPAKDVLTKRSLNPRSNDEINDRPEKEQHMMSNGNLASDCHTGWSLTLLDSEARSKNVESSINQVHDELGLLKPKFEDESRNENVEGMGPCVKRKWKHPLPINLGPDSIAARLRQRHRKSNGQDTVQFMQVNERNSDLKLAVNNMLSNQKVEKENIMHVKDDKRTDATISLESSPKLKKRGHAAEPCPDSIGARLHQRHKMSNSPEQNESLQTNMLNQGGKSDLKQAVDNVLSNQDAEKDNKMHVKDNKHGDATISLESSPKLRKRGHAAEPCPDSIGARLRQRHRISKCPGHDESLWTNMLNHAGISNLKQAVNKTLCDQNIEKENKSHDEVDKRACATGALESSPKPKEHERAAENSPDSIGARLRQMRRMNTGLEKDELQEKNEKPSDKQQAFFKKVKM